MAEHIDNRFFSKLMFLFLIPMNLYGRPDVKIRQVSSILNKYHNRNCEELSLTNITVKQSKPVTIAIRLLSCRPLGMYKVETSYQIHEFIDFIVGGCRWR